MNHKIFGVGLNKTGTTTLRQCGKMLGYRCTNYDRRLLEDYILRNDFTLIKERVNQFDLFQDWPWPLIYKELDDIFPGSKFILTVRKSASVWLESLKKHSMRTHPTKHCRKLAYGYNYPHKHEQHFISFYRNHNNKVRTHFKDRDRDFIELCWENGDGFEQLCNFLRCAIPNTPFPHTNIGLNQNVDKLRIMLNKILKFF